MSYFGCDIDSTGKQVAVDFSVDLEVSKEMVYKLTLNQYGLTDIAVRPNEVITLEKLYDAMGGK